VITDRPPRNKFRLTSFIESDRLTRIEIPQDDRLNLLASSIESAMETGRRGAVRQACLDFMVAASKFYGVSSPGVRALAARPIRVRDRGAIELFGDYSPSSALIRIWTRTAVKKQVTSFGTFLSTLCHEFCHHLDCQRFGFKDSPHTRGFYERTATLYHHARGTPRKQLSWIRMPQERWRVDWRRMSTPAGNEAPARKSSEQNTLVGF